MVHCSKWCSPGASTEKDPAPSAASSLIVLRPHHPLLKAYEGKEMVPVNLASADGTSQSNLALPYPNNFPVPSKNAAVDVDLVSNLKGELTESVNIVFTHG